MSGTSGTSQGRSEAGDVIILDYGSGNLRSVVRAVERVGFRAQVAGIRRRRWTRRAW